MSTAVIRRLRDVRSSDSAEVGGKAASLGVLLEAGFRVPDGIVIPASSPLAPTEPAVLQTAVAELGAGPFAVRSSASDEDGMHRSHAGMYDSVLEVTVADLPAAVERVRASVGSARAGAYASGPDRGMAVIVQNMVPAVAAGVALTADPINGDRATTIVTAIRGTGERLVSGAAMGDEWTVRDGAAMPRRLPEEAIDRGQAELVASEARRIAEVRGVPQDVEWAMDGTGVLWIVQARPMTALPPDVSWDPPAAGAYSRSLRFAEWISDPVTPLFESWLLTAMEERTHADYLRILGQRVPRPYHVVVNGWYFYTLNWATPGAFARNLPNMLWHGIRSPRTLAGINPGTVHHAVPIMEREWRADVRPRHLAAVAAAEEHVEAFPVAELPRLIDELADDAGESFTWVTALAGAGYKLEVNLARFYRRHLAPLIGGSHLPLLTGFDAPSDPARHAVASLDWWHAPGSRAGSATRPAADHAALVEARHAAEEAAFSALASSPRRQRTFRQLVERAQHLVPLREEQVAELTLGWPVMRRAVVRIGEALAAGGTLAEPDDVFFLTHDEVLAALSGGVSVTHEEIAARRATREQRASLVPPLIVGRLNPMLRKLFESMPRVLGAEPSDTAIVSGTPASPGRALGSVRVIRGPEQFETLEPGEILVASLTAPAWTPLFVRAAAVVTDVGSAASHASIIAREYGIPAVVGCGDATARLTTGMRVMVDGSTGNVEPA